MHHLTSSWNLPAKCFNLLFQTSLSAPCSSQSDSAFVHKTGVLNEERRQGCPKALRFCRTIWSSSVNSANRWVEMLVRFCKKVGIPLVRNCCWWMARYWLGKCTGWSYGCEEEADVIDFNDGWTLALSWGTHEWSRVLSWIFVSKCLHTFRSRCLHSTAYEAS